jgi:glycosyltransferase involved in cell wall biosynthesis
MKIIINAMSAKTGGIATYTNNLARSFAKRKVDATFAVPSEFKLDSEVKKIIVTADKMPPFQRFLWEQVIWRQIVSKNKADILFSSANFGLLFSITPQVLLLREGGLFDPFYLKNIGSVLSTRKIIERIARRKLILASTRSAKLILTPSVTLKKNLITWQSDLESQIEVNNYGTNPSLFSSKLPKRYWREGGVLKLLYISVYYPHKQPGLVAEAVRLLNSMGVKCHLTLTMNKEEIKKMNGGEKDYFLLSKSVSRGQSTLVGNVAYKDLSNIYATHDLLVFPSISETFGHPLVEAMSMGLPILASDTPIHREICKNAARFFSPLKLSSLVKEVHILNKNEKLRASLIKSGLELTDKNYQWEDHVDRLLNSFKKITDFKIKR